jgi:hypothetical protein
MEDGGIVIGLCLLDHEAGHFKNASTDGLYHVGGTDVPLVAAGNSDFSS